jgi:hypothetical protein
VGVVQPLAQPPPEGGQCLHPTRDTITGRRQQPWLAGGLGAQAAQGLPRCMNGASNVTS